MDLLELETPALLIEEHIMRMNIQNMQNLANDWGVFLRPHIKTHKSTYIARQQRNAGAVGLTVAKVSEAEVFAEDGFDNLFISSEIVTPRNLEKIAALQGNGCNISFAVDSLEGLKAAEVFFSEASPARVLIEIDTGDNRTGICDDDMFKILVNYISSSQHLSLKGIFSHEGHAYHAETQDEVIEIFRDSQSVMAQYVSLASSMNMELERVSIGSTPSILAAVARGEKLNKVITEIRPGTYVYMDVGQAKAINDCSVCAATVLTHVISKPSSSRVVGDSGAKALTLQSRDTGICRTPGLGCVFGMEDVHITQLYDEHAVIEHEEFARQISVGDIFRVVPNHICPVVNLFDHFYIVNGMRVIQKLKVDARGMSS